MKRISELFQKPMDATLARFGYVRVKEPVPRNYLVFTFTDRDLMRTTILNTVRNSIGFKSPANDEMASDLSHRIMAALENSKSISLTDTIRELNAAAVSHPKPKGGRQLLAFGHPIRFL